MQVEGRVRYPKGTYEVQLSRLCDNNQFYIQNLITGDNSSSFTVWDVIKLIENDINVNMFPQRSFEYRSWGISKQECVAKLSESSQIDIPVIGSVPKLCGPTFVIKVLYQQHATWQGTIQWIERNRTIHFRSVNELLVLIEEAIDNSELKNDQ